MNGLFATWLLKTCADTPSATSSPGSAAGPTPPASPGGPTNAPCGQEAPLASPSPSPGKVKRRKTSATSGPSSLSLSAPVGPLSSWENRLRQRLERIGSTECNLTWKASATPAGRPLSRLVPSMRPIEEIDFGLWPTPTLPNGGRSIAHADEWRGNTPYHKGKKIQVDLSQVAKAMWPTPNANNHKGAYTNPDLIQARKDAGRQQNLQDYARWTAMWPTPTARDHFPAHTPEYIAAKKAQGHGMSNLNDTVSLAMWPTPMAHEARLGYQRRMGDAKGSQKSLTTEATDALGLGENVTGLQEQTEKPGALNPEFVCWLMGFPPEWDACAPTATPSSRKSRQK